MRSPKKAVPRSYPPMRIAGDDGVAGKKKGRAVRKAKEGRISKSQLIRDTARKMIERGLRPSPTEIARKLDAEEGVFVLPAQVSMALRGTGMEFRASEKARTPGLAGRLPDPATAMGLISLEDLLEVREFVGKIGGVEKALAAVIAFRHMGEQDRKIPKAN